MQDFHYNYIKNKCGDKAEILLTDIDSFMYIIEVENIYEEFCKNKQLFDFSDHLKESKYYNNGNNSVVGKIKNETRGVPLKSFA